MPLFSKEKSKVYLLVYFNDDRPLLKRDSFNSRTRANSIQYFENAIKNQRLGTISLHNYRTAIIKDMQTNEDIVKYVNGKKRL